MSSSIRRELELLNEDEKSDQKKKRQQTPGSASVMDLVSTKRQGVSRQVKRLQGRLGPGKSKATVKNKRIKSAVEEFRKTQMKSQMETNLKYFMGTGYSVTDSETVKIQSQLLGRQSRNRPDRPAAKLPKEPESLFSEAEFQRFQKEYFGRTVEEKD